MNTLTRRSMRLALLTVVFAGLFIAVNAVPGAATPATGGFASTLLGSGRYVSHGSLQLVPDLQIAVYETKVPKFATSGWHSHPGGAIVVVAEGQITTYRVVASEQANGDGNTGNLTCS